MSLTLLLDLDDTLFDNPLGLFQKNYLKALGAHLNALVPAERMIPQLLFATAQMTAKQTVTGTLEETFDRHFYPALGLDKAVLGDRIYQFYTTVFPALQQYTRPRPAAVELVTAARQRGWTVAVATNPLFPRIATLQRVGWAGFDPADFALISTYENFHFAKPQPAYYTELLAQLGWPEGPVVMVGNDPADDIVPAAAVGLSTWLLQSETTPGGGPLEAVLPWLDELAAHGPAPTWNAPTALLAALQSTPAALDTLIEGLPRSIWSQPPAPGEWSLLEIICHLRDVDREINLPRMQLICCSGEDNPFLPGVSADGWVAERHYAAEALPAALLEMQQSRGDLLALLADLPAESWARPARHAIFGPTRLLELVEFMVTHDQNHVRQSRQAVSAAAGQR
ncbi:MAG TPA: DinB family protein [Anaerolineaceae bacterium]|nr:DinB family protein [Anaerolineaceae bacterium]